MVNITNYNELYHFGVPGMKWGQHKAAKSYGYKLDTTKKEDTTGGVGYTTAIYRKKNRIPRLLDYEGNRSRIGLKSDPWNTYNGKTKKESRERAILAEANAIKNDGVHNADKHQRALLKKSERIENDNSKKTDKVNKLTKKAERADSISKKYESKYYKALRRGNQKGQHVYARKQYINQLKSKKYRDKVNKLLETNTVL